MPTTTPFRLALWQTISRHLDIGDEQVIAIGLQAHQRIGAVDRGGNCVAGGLENVLEQRARCDRIG